MMPVQIVILWSDVLIWLLLVATGLLGWASLRHPPQRACWSKVGENPMGVAAATCLLAFVLVGLLDSMHYRQRLDSPPDRPAVYAVEVLSVLDLMATPLRTQNEKTYSAPFATRLYAKENLNQPGQPLIRDYPRLTFGGRHLGEEEALKWSDVTRRALTALLAGTLIWAGVVALLSWRHVQIPHSVHFSTVDRLKQGFLALFSRQPGQFCWPALLVTLGLMLLTLLPLFALSPHYHVFGTDKVGQDVLYQILKSIRTALVIGLITTLVMMPLALVLGIVAGYFRGWIDDLIQYLYTVLSAIPGVLLIAAAVLMMQVVIDTHPNWFATAAERADLRLLALCFILGLTSWTSLCRLLRGETLKLRTLDYIQAAQAFGVSHPRIILRHILPNLMHIVIIALVMDFSGLVLAEAVLSYVGIGVDPTMTSFGTMINNARMELGREPVVWWSLLAAFSTMFLLVLAANLFADAVRDAFDPRAA